MHSFNRSPPMRKAVLTGWLLWAEGVTPMIISSGSSASRRLWGSWPGFAPPGREFSRVSFLSVDGGFDDVRESFSGRWSRSTSSINCSLLSRCKSPRSIPPWIQRLPALARGLGNYDKAVHGSANSYRKH